MLNFICHFVHAAYVQCDSEIGGNILGTCSTNEIKQKLHTNMGPKILSFSAFDTLIFRL
jgi:hypothetical protein